MFIMRYYVGDGNMKKIEDEKIEEQELQKQDDEDEKTSYWPYLFLFTIIMFFCVFGISYSIYRGDDPSDSEIDVGNIIFTYSDVNQGGSGILLKNAFPTTDTVGKAMVGRGQYFDFYITANTKSSDLEYKLLINKSSSSTLKDNNVRIYLTQVMGSYEKELVLTDFSSLKTERILGKDYYVLYVKRLASSENTYNDSYRLRMWVKKDAIDFQNQYFSIKVDVNASQVEE